MRLRALGLAAALVFASPAAKAEVVTPDYPASRADCPREGPYCRIRRDVDPEDLARRLGDRDFVSWTDGPELHVAVRAAKPPTFCCTIQAPMARVGQTDLWTLSLHVPRLDEAVIMLAYVQMDDPQRPLHSRGEFRGPRARRPAPASAPLIGKVEAIQLDSAALGHATAISIYRPPQSAGPIAGVVYLADGTVDTYAPVLERLILDRRVPPTMIVGFSAYDVPGADAAARSALRNGQYRRGADPAAMAHHDRFVFDEVLPRAEAGLDHQRLTRITAGTSNGGAWAFTAALARPDLFQAAVAMSPAVRGVDLSGLPARAGQAFFMSAGLFEGLGNARIAYDHVGDGSARRCLLEGVDGHSPSLYRDFFPLAVEAALQKDGCPRWP